MHFENLFQEGYMARQLRIEFPGAFYHVMVRGDRWEPIVENQAERHLFVKTMAYFRAGTERLWH